MIENLNLIFSEIFLSLSIMFLLILGVYKKKSSTIVYNLSIISLVIIFFININLFGNIETDLFSKSYLIDYLSTFMKFLIIISGIFVMLTSSKYLKIQKIFKIEYPILLLSSILGMMIMISSNDLIVFYTSIFYCSSNFTF